MKKVEAIVSAEGFISLVNVLEDLGCKEVTVTTVYGRAENPAVRVWRGIRTVPEMSQRTKLEVLVDDEILDAALGLIRQHPSVGAAGNRRIAVFSLEEQYVEQRSGERVLAGV